MASIHHSRMTLRVEECQARTLLALRKTEDILDEREKQRWSKKMEREMGGRTQRSGTTQRWLNSDRTSVI